MVVYDADSECWKQVVAIWAPARAGSARAGGGGRGGQPRRGGTVYLLDVTVRTDTEGVGSLEVWRR